jgi:hypothetical protein
MSLFYADQAQKMDGVAQCRAIYANDCIDTADIPQEAPAV